MPEITGPSGQFRHRQHINLAFLAVRRYGMPEARARICDWIQRIAAYERAPQKYHHTVSRAWVEIVAHHVDADPDCADFGTFARRNPALLDKRLLRTHYRSSTLAADPARRGWVEPDLVPFPWAAQGGQAGLTRHSLTAWPFLSMCSDSEGPWAYSVTTNGVDDWESASITRTVYTPLTRTSAATSRPNRRGIPGH